MSGARFFDTLIKVFANYTKTSFSNIPSLLQYIGFVVANNRRINFAQLTWHVMVRRIIASKWDFGLGNKVSCYYPRFLSVILNHVLSPEHTALFNNSAFEVAQTTTKKFYTWLATSLKFTNVSCCCYSLFIQLHTSPRHTNTNSHRPSISSGSIHSSRSFNSPTGKSSYLWYFSS